ncbi:MAG: hypothetical protein ACI35W_04000 [Anaeroplasmataceae bacterium]
MRYIDFKKLMFSRMMLIMYLPFDLDGNLIIRASVDVGVSKSLLLELEYPLNYDGLLEVGTSESLQLEAQSPISIYAYLDITTLESLLIEFNSYLDLQMVGTELELSQANSLHIDSKGELSLAGSLAIDCFNLCAVESKGKVAFYGGSIDAHTSNTIELATLSKFETGGFVSLEILEIKTIPSINGVLQCDAFLDMLGLDSYPFGMYGSYNSSSSFCIQLSQEKHFETKGQINYKGTLSIDLLVINTWFNILDNTWDFAIDNTWEDILFTLK